MQIKIYQKKSYRRFVKASGGWGGWGKPQKLKIVCRRILRRVEKLEFRRALNKEA